MKKSLPTLRTSGFTLIELMVVISIIAILAVVGFGTYQGVQGSARDTRKLAEINVLAKNIESTKGVTTQNYYYTPAKFFTDYPGSGLLDPKFSTGYCLKLDASAITKPANWVPANDSPCPDTTWTALINSSSGTPPVWAAGSWTAPTANSYFMVCAAAERGTDALCQGPFTK